MVLAKLEPYEAQDVQLAEWAKALGHPARIAILRHLANNGACICGEIVEALPLAQSTVSQHLKALKEVGLIVGEIEGPKTCYCLHEKAIREMSLALSSCMSDISIRCSKTAELECPSTQLAKNVASPHKES